MNRDEVLKLAALAAKWKEPAKDALDTMVLSTLTNVLTIMTMQLEYAHRS